MNDAPVIQFEVVDSTMDELAALRAARAVEPWTAILTNFQRKGRGRAGRSWHAPPNSALLSTIYAPIVLDPARVGMLAIAAGLAVAEALTTLDVEATLKWPNDVLANDRKLAGILISSQIGETIEASIGIGLNLSAAPPAGIALSELHQSPPSPTEMLVAIRAEMIRLWTDLEGGHFPEISSRWNSIAAWAGQMVSVPDELDRTGRLIGVDEWGRLRLDTVKGELRLTQSEIVRGPVPPVSASYTFR